MAKRFVIEESNSMGLVITKSHRMVGDQASKGWSPSKKSRRRGEHRNGKKFTSSERNYNPWEEEW